MGELHRERCSSLGERSKVGSISKHTREGNLSCDHTGPPPVFSFRCLASSGVKIAHDLAHKLFGGDDLDRHQGFKKNRAGSPGTFLETDRTGNLEGHLRGIDIMVRSVDERNLDVDHRVPRQDSSLHRLFDPFLNSGDELLGDGPPDDPIHKLKSLSRALRFKHQPDMAVLASPSRLADKPALGLDRLCFANGHSFYLWLPS